MILFTHLDWNFAHKYECKAVYKRNYEKLPDERDRLLLRLYLVLSNKPSLASLKFKLPYNENIERSFEDLMSHKDRIRAEDPLTLMEMGVIKKRYDKCNIDIDFGTMFEYLCKLCINSHPLGEDIQPFVQSGSVLCIVNSSFDHSCFPNSGYVFVEGRSEVRAYSEINPGDKITIDYVHLTCEPSYRRVILEKGFYFTCDCLKCTSDFDQSKNIFEFILTFKKSQTFTFYPRI